MDLNFYVNEYNILYSVNWKHDNIHHCFKDMLKLWFAIIYIAFLAHVYIEHWVSRLFLTSLKYILRNILILRNKVFLRLAYICVANKKSRSVLYNCVIIFIRSSGIMDCMLFIFEMRAPLMRWGIFGVASSIPLSKSFNKTESVIYPMRAILPDECPYFYDYCTYYNRGLMFKQRRSSILLI